MLRRAYSGHVAAFRGALGALQPDDPLGDYLPEGPPIQVIVEGVRLLTRHGLFGQPSTWQRLIDAVPLYGDEIRELAGRWGHTLDTLPQPEAGLLPGSPFKDLAPYSRADAAIFFGRRRTITTILLVLRDPAARVVLVYGPTGVGKSSVLQAGVLPRAGVDFHGIYVHHTISVSLLTSVHTALGGESLRTGWLAAEREHGRPVTVILDQVESAYTTEAGEERGDLELAALLTALLREPGDGELRGKLVLGVRKEWLAEVLRPFAEHRVVPSRIEIPRLDFLSIREIIRGPTRHYKLSFEDEVEAQIARDLLRDTNSPVAPTLQVLLTQLWNEATIFGDGERRITCAQYDDLGRKEERFKLHIQQRLRDLADASALRQAVEAGLALDLLFECTTASRTTRVIPQVELERRYGPIVIPLIEACIEARLLRREGKDEHAPTDVSLMHDTIVPVVWVLFRESSLPGQKARRLLARLVESYKDSGSLPRLDRADLEVLEHGRAGMRMLEALEVQILEDTHQRLATEQAQQAEAAARELRSIRDLAETQSRAATQRLLYLRLVGTLGGLALIAAVISYVYYRAAEDQAKAAADSASIAKDRTRVADEATRKAEIDQQAAQQAAARLRDQRRWSTIRAAEDDPTTQVALLREMELPEESRELLDAVFGVLQRPIAQAVWTHAGRPMPLISPDNRSIITIADRTWTLWRSNDGTPRILNRTDPAPTSYSFTPDSRLLALAWDETPPEIWRTDGAGEPIRIGDTPAIHVAFSGDGRRLAIVFKDGMTQVMRMDGVETLRTIWDLPAKASRALFSPDGRSLLTSSDNAYRLWRLDDSRSVVTLGPGGFFERFSADGQHVLTLSRTGRVMVWRTDGSEKLVREIQAEIRVMSSDGRNALLRTKQEVLVLSMGASVEVVRLAGISGESLSTATFSATDDRVVAGDMNGRIGVWDTRNGARVLTLQPPPLTEDRYGTMMNSVGQIEISPDGRQIAAVYRVGIAALWSVAAGPPVLLGDQGDKVSSAAFSADGRSVLTTTARGVIVTSAHNTRNAMKLRVRMQNIREAMFLDDGARVLSIDGGGEARVWRTGSPLPVPRPGVYKKADISADWSRLVTVDSEGEFRLWFADRLSPEKLHGSSNSSGPVAISTDGTRVIMGSGDLATIQKVGSEEQVVLRGHAQDISDVAFSSDGRRALTVSHGVRLWDVNGREVAAIPMERDGPAALFSSDESLVVTGISNGAVRVWRADAGVNSMTWSFGGAKVTSVSFSPDGTRVLMCTEESSNGGLASEGIWVGPTDGNGELTPLEGGAVRGIRFAAFSPDGSQIVATSGDQMRVWSNNGGLPAIQRSEHFSSAVAMAISADGSRMITIGGAGDMHILPICAQRSCSEELWQATTYCLSETERQIKLGEQAEDAVIAVAACHAKVGEIMARGEYR